MELSLLALTDLYYFNECLCPLCSYTTCGHSEDNVGAPGIIIIVIIIIIYCCFHQPSPHLLHLRLIISNLKYKLFLKKDTTTCQKHCNDQQRFWLDFCRDHSCGWSILVGLQGCGTREPTGWDPEIPRDADRDPPDIGHTWYHTESCGSRWPSWAAGHSCSKQPNLWVHCTDHTHQQHYHSPPTAWWAPACEHRCSEKCLHPTRHLQRRWHMHRVWKSLPGWPSQLLALQNLPAWGSLHLTVPKGQLWSHRPQQPARRWRRNPSGGEDWPPGYQLRNPGGHPPVQANNNLGTPQGALENQVTG